MLQQLETVAIQTGRLLDAKGRLLFTDLERLLRRSIVRLVGALLLMIGALTLLAAGVMGLAEAIGWVGALASAGGVAVIGALLALFAASRREPGRARPLTRAELVREAERQERSLHDAFAALSPDGEKAAGKSPAGNGFVRSLSEHPEMLASAAFAALTVLGPARSARVLGRAATAAGLAASLGRATKGWFGGRNGVADASAGSSPPGRTGVGPPR